MTQAEPAPLQRLAVVGAQLYVTAMQLLEAGKKHAVVNRPDVVPNARKLFIAHVLLTEFGIDI